MIFSTRLLLIVMLTLLVSFQARAYSDIDLRFVAGSVVYLRSAPDEKSEILARVPIGTRVTVESEAEPWCEVRVPPNALARIGNAGYMSCTLLRRHAYSSSEIYRAIASSSQRVYRDPSWGKVTRDDWRARALATERAFWYSPSLRWLFDFHHAQRMVAEMEGQPDPARTADIAVWPMRRLLEVGFSTSDFSQLPLSTIDMSRRVPLKDEVLEALRRRYPNIQGKTSFFAEGHEVAGFVGAPFVVFDSEQSAILATADRADELANWTLTNVAMHVQARFPKPRRTTHDAEPREDRFFPINFAFDELKVYGLSEYGLSHLDFSRLTVGGDVNDESDCEQSRFNVSVRATNSDPLPLMFLLSSRKIDTDARAIRESISAIDLDWPTLVQVWSVDFDKDDIPDVLMIVSSSRLSKQEVPAGPGPIVQGSHHAAILLANVGGKWGYVSGVRQWGCSSDKQIHHLHSP